MCGIVAVVRTDLVSIERAAEMLGHRGMRTKIMSAPTGTTIAHVRLPIVGLGEEHDQPVDADRWIVAFVGEVLDFKEHYPRLECDLDLVLSTWVDQGHAGFRKHDGFWSVVAVDKLSGHVHVLVDYLAQKPMYWRSDAHAVAVASEPDAVACLGPVTPDPIYFSSIIKWGYCPETWRTPYCEVQKTLPGEYVVLGCASGNVTRKIVDPIVPNRSATPFDLKVEICTAVQRRVLSSDVPVAALVSGGLDSAIVYTLARRWGEVRPYHVENGEALAASAVVGRDKATLLDCRGVSTERGLNYMQEPIDLGSLFPQVALSDAIARSGGERVCLTGDGADEMFGGYGRAQRYDSQASDVFHELVAWHLPRLDRVMMRNRIEVRSPFLARRVAEIALGLRREYRIDKQILRDLFREDLPAGLAERPKKALRTRAVEDDREGWSKHLVEEFKQRKWPDEDYRLLRVVR